MIADELNKLKQTKASIKLALIDKGLNPSDVFSTYADGIRAIEVGSGGSTISKSNLFYLKDATYTTNDIQSVLDLNAEDPKFVFGSYYHSTGDVTYYKPTFENVELTFSGTEISSFIVCIPKSVNHSDVLADFKGNIVLNFPNANKFKYIQGSYAVTSTTNWASFDKLTINLKEGVNMHRCFSNWYLTDVLEGQIQINAKPSILDYAFYECKMKWFPNSLDFSLCTSMRYAFYNGRFTTIPDMDLPNILSLQYTFSGIYATKAGNINAPKATTASFAFYTSPLLQLIGDIYTPLVTDFSSFFDSSSLVKVNSIDVSSANNLTSIISRNVTVPANWTFKNIGTKLSCNTFNATKLQKWGDESNITQYPLSEGARQSLIDSLITHSFDRATAGYPTCTVQLYSTTKALLTEDEIALITAKGYTIS